jgi:hypothetical protein
MRNTDNASAVSCALLQCAMFIGGRERDAPCLAVALKELLVRSPRRLLISMAAKTVWEQCSFVQLHLKKI